MPTMIREAVARAVAVAVVVTAPSAAVLAQSSASATSRLPAPVLNAFQQAYPGAVIASVANQKEGSRTTYRVESTDKGRTRILTYEASGSVIQLAEPVAEKDLPAPVAAAVRSHRRAIYVSGLKVTRGGGTEYQLTLRGSRKTAMVVKPDGTVLSFQ